MDSRCTRRSPCCFRWARRPASQASTSPSPSILWGSAGEPIARILAYTVLPDRAATVRERWLTPWQPCAPSRSRLGLGRHGRPLLCRAPQCDRRQSRGREYPLRLAIPRRTILVHNGVMRIANRAVRQSVSLPANVAAQVRSLAKARRLSANRMLLELIENGLEADKRKQQEFFDLAERFRSATDPEDVKRLGEQMGRMVFGNVRGQ